MSEIIRDIKGYPVSRDYAKLWKLAQTQSVVCVVDYLDCRDVAQTIRSFDHVHISARGITYAYGDDLERFVRSCEKAGIEWLVPSEGGAA